jgi:hypothetical protein
MAGIQITVAGCGIHNLAEVGQNYEERAVENAGISVISSPGLLRIVEKVIIKKDSISTERFIQKGDSLKKVIHAYGRGKAERNEHTKKTFLMSYDSMGIAFKFGVPQSTELLENTPVMEIHIFRPKGGGDPCPWEMPLPPSF